MTPLPLPGMMSLEFRGNAGTPHRNASTRRNKRACTHRILIRDFVLFRAPLEAHDGRLSDWSRQRGAACAPWLYRSAAGHGMGPCAKAARPRTQTLSASSSAAALPPDCRRGTRCHTLSAKMRLRHAAPSLDGSAAARDSWVQRAGPALQVCSGTRTRRRPQQPAPRRCHLHAGKGRAERRVRPAPSWCVSRAPRGMDGTGLCAVFERQWHGFGVF
jgi:hypothetical protein